MAEVVGAITTRRGARGEAAVFPTPNEVAAAATTSSRGAGTGVAGGRGAVVMTWMLPVVTEGPMAVAKGGPCCCCCSVSNAPRHPSPTGPPIIGGGGDSMGPIYGLNDEDISGRERRGGFNRGEGRVFI